MVYDSVSMGVSNTLETAIAAASGVKLIENSYWFVDFSLQDTIVSLALFNFNNPKQAPCVV